MPTASKPRDLPSNLPIPVLSTFTNDQLALIFGTCLADAAFMTDRETGRLVAANEALLRLLGQTLDALDDSDRCFDAYVHPDDRGVFRTWVQGEPAESQTSFEIRFIGPDGTPLPVEVTLKSLRWQGREFRLGFIRDASERLKQEALLKERLRVEKSRAMQALKNSLRVYELNEKIKSTLELTTRLLNVENEQQLFSEAERVLTNAEGLNFRDVIFLVLEGNELRVANSRGRRGRQVFPLGESNKYSRWIRHGGAGKDFEAAPGEILIPLRSRDSLLGIIEVFQHQRERVFFEECELVREWQHDMLLQIGDIIALILDNLRLKRELKRQSTIDPLTQAYNRNYFMNRLAAEIHRAHRYRRPASLVFLDVDHFKSINDTYGHLQGDQILRELGGLLRRNLRDTDILCRYGGDEFVILLPETEGRRAVETAEKLHRAVREHKFTVLDQPAQSLSVTISVGTTTLQDGQDEEAFLQSADTALYEAKRSGRDQTAVLDLRDLDLDAP